MCRKKILLAFLLITIFTFSLIADRREFVSVRVSNQYFIMLQDRDNLDDFLESYERYEMKLIKTGPIYPGNRVIFITLVVSFNDEQHDGDNLLEIIKADERVIAAQFVHQLFNETETPGSPSAPPEQNNQQGINHKI